MSSRALSLVVAVLVDTFLAVPTALLILVDVAILALILAGMAFSGMLAYRNRFDPRRAGVGGE